MKMKNGNVKTSMKSFVIQTGAIPPSVGYCMNYPRSANHLITTKNNEK